MSLIASSSVMLNCWASLIIWHKYKPVLHMIACRLKLQIIQHKMIFEMQINCNNILLLLPFLLSFSAMHRISTQHPQVLQYARCSKGKEREHHPTPSCSTCLDLLPLLICFWVINYSTEIWTTILLRIFCFYKTSNIRCHDIIT